MGCHSYNVFQYIEWLEPIVWDHPAPNSVPTHLYLNLSRLAAFGSNRVLHILDTYCFFWFWDNTF
mgnify:CR=1 FL=1